MADNKKDTVALQLLFTLGEKPELWKIVSTVLDDEFCLTRKANKADMNGFDWGPGTQGFVLALLNYKLSGWKISGCYDYYGSKKASPAASACSVIDKQQWLQGAFSFDDKTNLDIAKQVFKVHKSKDRPADIAFRIDSDRLPPENIKVLSGDSERTKELTAKEIRKLLQEIKWKPHRATKQTVMEEHPSQPIRVEPRAAKPPSLRTHPNQALRQLIRGAKWIVGAVNLDEDIHFSSFYLRQSSRRNLRNKLKDFGYSRIIAIYHDFNERYYLPENECTEVAERLVKVMLEEPDWFQHDILDEIQKRVNELDRVFKRHNILESLGHIDERRLLEMYRAHNKAHMELYEVARVPETLDRGVGYFTNYLRNYLRGRLPGDSAPRQISELFDTLTYPEVQSKKVEEIEELFNLAREIKERYGDNVLKGSSKRILLEIEPLLMQKVEGHRDKWSFWGYHGYGARATYDINHYISQMSDAATKGTVSGINPIKYHSALEHFEERRRQCFKDLGVDSAHQMLFRFYSRIGNAKIARRFVQLRNFYMLDLLLREIARKRSLSEAVVRSLLPEEIETLLKRKEERPTEVQRKRAAYGVFVLTESEEIILSGNEFSWVELELEKSIRPESRSGQSLSGLPLCPGIAKGQAKVVNHREDAEKVGFRKGDILVSHSADPELAELIEDAAGVLVQSGGVTCHAAIICRELAKPAISNIPNLLEEIHNNDNVILDAFTGTIEICRPDLLSYVKYASDIQNQNVAQFGAKAVTLAHLRHEGMNVPNFFAVPLAEVEFFGKPQDAVGVEKDIFIQEVKRAVDSLQGSMFIIRSSMLDEDSGNFTNAGKYFSEHNIDKEDVIETMLRVLQRYKREQSELQGSIIVQEMVLADYSGVCFTKNPVNLLKAQMLIEIVPGGNESLTSGEVSPKGYFFDRDTRILEEADSNSRWCNLIENEQLRHIAETCERVEKIFGRPQDIEWTLKGNELWIVQSRAIQEQGGAVKHARTRRMVTDSRSGLRDILTICRAYRVPPALKRHLLRVAAVGSVISDNWSGPELDKEKLVKALLLHDIGNIVKADYRKNIELYPDEMRDFKYWLTVQEMIRDRFGDTDREATLNIARDIGVDKSVLELIEQKQFILNEETTESQNWERKIGAYADQRVAPQGVMTLQARLDEARHRYAGIEKASVNSPRFEALRDAAFRIERQIAKFTTIQLSSIDDQRISAVIECLKTKKLF